MPLFKYTEFLTETFVDIMGQDGIFVLFGDNVDRKGTGGLAKVCRNKQNCIGIPTKWHPRTDQISYFRDCVESQNIVKNNLFVVEELLKLGKTIVCPYDSSKLVWNIGTGLAKLNLTAPKTHVIIQNTLDRLFHEYAKTNTEIKS